MIRKNLIKSLSLVMATMLAVMTVACGHAETDTQIQEAVSETAEEAALEESMVKNSHVTGTESDASKVETVYVTADANGAVNDVIVSEWLKNATASSEIADTTQLKDIVNVKGDETYKDNGDGTLTWDAEGSDIFYQGTTDKELPVNMKITYTLNGKEISPEELAGKSGRVTIRFEYENNARQTVNVDGKDIEVYTPFAMVSGMMLDADKFTNVEISNGKVISEGGNYVVMGVALPGLKESLDISDDKWDKLDDADEIKEKLSNSFEITADTSDFELGMTITMASSDILSDFGLTDITGSDKIADLKSDMGDLNDGGNDLVEGTKTLKDGTSKLREGTDKLADGTSKLSDGASDLYDGTSKLYDGTDSLCDGTSKLYDGTKSLNDGASKLYDGTKSLYDGAGKLNTGAGSLYDGTKTLYDGGKSLSDGAAVLSQGIKAYTEGATQILMGAGQLKSGVQAAKAGSEQLIAGVTDAQTNAQKLAEGASGVNDGVKLVQTMMGNLVKASDKLAEIKSKQDLYGAAYTWLTNTSDTESEPSAEVLAVLQSIDSGISSCHDAVKVKKAALAALTGQTTSSLYVIDNYEELVNVVETGALYASEGDTEDGPAEADTKEAEDAKESAQESGESEDNKEAAQENSSDSSDSSNETGTAEKEQSETESATGEDGSEAVGASEAQAEGAAKAGEVIEEETNLSTTGNETKKVIVKNVQTGYSDSDVARIADYVRRYSVLCGATQGAYSALGTVYGEISAMMIDLLSEDTAKNIDDLAKGAEQVAAGCALLAGDNGLGKLKAGQVSLDAGIGQVSDGVGAIYDGTEKLTSNNTQLNTGAAQVSAGAGQLKDGAGKLKDGAGQLKDGIKELKDGAGQLKDGAGELKDGTSQLKDGAGELKDGAGQLKDGAGQLKDGAGQLRDGAKELKDGAGELDDGAIKLDDGVQELMDGMIKFDEEGIKKLYEAFDGDLSDFADRMSAIQEAGKSYNSFGGSSEEENSSVKFIFKTDSVKSL